MILEKAEKIIREPCSDNFLNLMENVLNGNSGASIDFHQNNVVVSNEVCYYFVLLSKNIETQWFVSVFLQALIPEEKEEQLNLILFTLVLKGD